MKLLTHSWYFIGYTSLSVLPNMDMTGRGAHSTGADVIVVSETWLSKSSPNSVSSVKNQFNVSYGELISGVYVFE